MTDYLCRIQIEVIAPDGSRHLAVERSGATLLEMSQAVTAALEPKLAELRDSHPETHRVVTWVPGDASEPKAPADSRRDGEA